MHTISRHSPRIRIVFVHFLAFFVLPLLAMLPSASARAANMLADTEFTGQTYRSFELVAPVPDFCRKVCEKDEGCQGWTFAWPGKKGKRAKCFLFRSVTDKRKDTCCIAGYRKKNFSFGSAVSDWLKHDEKPRQASREASPERKESATVQEEGKPKTSRETMPSTANVSAADDELARDRQREEKRARCRAYAETAIAANREARKLGCGFRGGLWNASYEAYFRSCMKKPLQAAEWKTKKRAAQLRECRSEMARRQFEAPPPVEQRTEIARDEPPPAARELMRRAPYAYSWLVRSGPGPRVTPWRPSVSGKCPLVRDCECPQANTCGVYEPGDIATYWPLGCEGPPALVVCRVRRR